MKHLTELPVNKLYGVLVKFLRTHGYKKIVRDKSFIMAEGIDPICLIAHMDTVFKVQPNEEEFIYDQEKTILWSPYGSGFDDRAGIYSIIELIQRGYRPHVIFTDLEEVGGVGATALVEKNPKCPFTKCHALIQLDRANEKDSVFYSCDNKKFEKFINQYGFETDWGTFSDISVIAPAWRIAAVNLSIGYLDEHSRSERLVCAWTDNTIDKVSKIIEDINCVEQFEYIPEKIEYFHFHRYSDFSTCLLCGKSLTPQTRYEIYDTEYPYAVCKDCYNKYYTGFPPFEDELTV